MEMDCNGSRRSWPSIASAVRARSTSAARLAAMWCSSQIVGGFRSAAATGAGGCAPLRQAQKPRGVRRGLRCRPRIAGLAAPALIRSLRSQISQPLFIGSNLQASRPTCGPDRFAGRVVEAMLSVCTTRWPLWPCAQNARTTVARRDAAGHRDAIVPQVGQRGIVRDQRRGRVRARLTRPYADSEAEVRSVSCTSRPHCGAPGRHAFSPFDIGQRGDSSLRQRFAGQARG